MKPWGFSEYNSKPVVRLAHEVSHLDTVISVGESTSIILVYGGAANLPFKHYEEVKAGDFIIFLNKEDVYHCSREVFLERNIVDAVEKDIEEPTFITFGEATQAAKHKMQVARKGWNGKNMFAYVVPQEGLVRAHWVLKCADGSLAMWAPSGSDSLAEDWYVL